jgi:glycine betaine/proline transport system substrate-binding protein
MNIRYKLTYLENGENLFGPDDGAATVETLTRKGYATDCPNVSRFLSNLKFSTDMESTMMNMILNDGMEAKDAVTKWIKENPAQLDTWLDGVTTFDGKPALAEVKSGLGL